jgi:hypothetical protein
MGILNRLRILLAALLLALLVPIQAAPPSPNEYAVKAVFVYNFSRFIDWPRQAFESAGEPFIIGIVGEDPFGPLLAEAIQGEFYRGRPIQIRHFRGPGDIGRCHLLFISQANAANLDAILASVAGRNVLTVGETEAFLDRGGMIALIAEQNRVRLRINPASLRTVNLSVSSKLLQVADIRP